MHRPGLWNYGFTGALGGLTLGLLSTQNPTAAGLAAIAAMGAVGAAIQCWAWWSRVHPRDLCVRRQLNGRCVSCGYDLTGNVSGVCPECGDEAGNVARGRMIRDGSAATGHGFAHRGR